MIAKETLLTTQLTPSGCLNSRLRKFVNLVVCTKKVSFCYAVQNKKRLPGRDRTFFTTITTQNTLIKWKSDFWTYTTRHVSRAR